MSVTPSASPLSVSQIVRNFAPGWFAAVMGSGVLSITTLALATRWPRIEAFAWGLHYFNLLLFLVLTIPWLARWLAFPQAARATLQHPVQASFYPTFSIALLVIAAQFVAFGPQTGLALLFWWPGAALTFAFSFAVLYAMFSGEHVGLGGVVDISHRRVEEELAKATGIHALPHAGAKILGGTYLLSAVAKLVVIVLLRQIDAP